MSREIETIARDAGIDPVRVVLSLTTMAALLGVDGNTLRAWQREGLPILRRGSTKPRVNWAYDLKAVVDFLQQRAHQAGYEKAMKAKPPRGVTGDGELHDGKREGEDEVSYRTRVAQMRLAELKFAQVAKRVAPVDLMIATFTFHMRTVSTGLQTMKMKVQAMLSKKGVAMDESDRLVGEPIDRMVAALLSADGLADPLGVDGDVNDDGDGDEIAERKPAVAAGDDEDSDDGDDAGGEE